MSPGHFSRVFQAEIGQSPTKAVENLRVEAARILMERTRHSIDAVADRNRMRRVFGQPPLIKRRTAHGDFGVEKVGFDALTPES